MANPTSFLERVRSEFPADFLTQASEELETYGKDWTKVHIPAPLAVVFPRTTAEVSRFMQLCREFKLAVVPSGGRTGLSGGAVAANGEVVLSLSRMNRMEPVDTLAQIVRVQAGAITEAVHKHCEPYGLTWPVDFASKGSSQVGGNIATNAGGVKVIHYGMCRNWVLGLQVVTMSGEILELNGALEKNNTGIDLRQLFIGSEGTLGIVTEATLKLARLPESLEVFFFAVEDMSAVLKLFQEARRGPFRLMAFECLDHPSYELTLEKRHRSAPLEGKGGAYVLMEVETPHSEQARAALDRWLESLFEKGFVIDGTIAQSPREAKDLWKIREELPECLFLSGILHKNDIALPISSLERFVPEMVELFRQIDPNFKVFIFGHIGDGNLHVNTMKPEAMDKAVFLAKCKEADRRLFELVQAHQGSVSAEHGIGLLKKEALKFSRSEAELTLFRALKNVFDPDGLLNPGKIIDS